MADVGMTVGLIKALAPKPSAEDITTAVDAWLDDHPEATTTVEDGAISYAKLDSSLQGTVDNVADLKSQIDDLSTEVDGNKVAITWEQGSYNTNTGAKLSSASNIRTSAMITVTANKPVQIRVAANYRFRVLSYSTLNDLTSYIGYTPANSWYTGSQKLVTAGYYNLFLGRTDGTNIDTSAANNITVLDLEGSIIQNLDIIADEIETLNNAIDNVNNSINDLSEDIEYYDTNIMLKEFSDPFKPTVVHLFGDSITAGMGATGYDPSGEEVGSTTQKRDVSNSKSFANRLKKYIIDNYDKIITVPIAYNEHIDTSGKSSIYAEGNVLQNNIAAGKTFVQCDFYGTEIVVGYGKSNNYGIFNVYIDDMLAETIDTYASSFSFAETTITGLSEGTHNLKIQTTNTKNASSSGKLLVLSYLGIRKRISFINDGVVGYQSRSISILVRTLSTMDDTLIICTTGTNDRGSFSGPWCTEEVADYLCEWVKTNRPNATFVMQSANPCNNTYDLDNPDVHYHMYDVDMALRKACRRNNILFVSGYTACIDYMVNRNTNASVITNDGLHPNDNGHGVIFRNLIQTLGLSTVYDWQGGTPSD